MKNIIEFVEHALQALNCIYIFKQVLVWKVELVRFVCVILVNLTFAFSFVHRNGNKYNDNVETPIWAIEIPLFASGKVNKIQP